MKDHTAERISQVLLKACPAFARKSGFAGCEWHHCKCEAQCGSTCDCVWKEIDTCVAGTWPQLAFLKEIHRQHRVASDKALVEARAAVAKAKGG